MEACSLPGAEQAKPELCQLLKDAKVIVVVGLSPKSHRASNQVAKYLQEQGYKIVPVYPREEEILGEKVYRSLKEIDFPVDIVDIFRKSEDVPPIVEEAIRLPGVKCIFLQEGIRNELAEQIAKRAGKMFYQDDCLMVEHIRCKREGLL
ncbi:MAG: CoA-binding protein [Campylobacterales bacterium]